MVELKRTCTAGLDDPAPANAFDERVPHGWFTSYRPVRISVCMAYGRAQPDGERSDVEREWWMCAGQEGHLAGLQSNRTIKHFHYSSNSD